MPILSFVGVHVGACAGIPGRRSLGAGDINNQVAHTIRGRVTTADGRPLSYAILKSGQAAAVTDTSGDFLLTISSLPCMLTASALGFQAQQKMIQNVEDARDVSFILSESAVQMREVVVEANHEPQGRLSLDNISVSAPAPLTVITGKTIAQMGSRRLDEVLREQTGLAIVSDVGSGSRAVGLQMQGFDAAYTMIMIDGQPLIGRNAGSLDLSRITVADIERIEIVKGASSSLFGSDALAGTVNIVTRKNISAAQALAQLRYGTNNNVDATLEGEGPFASGRGSGYLSANYYSTDGFNVNPYLTYGRTAPPYSSYTLQARGRCAITQNTGLSVSGRYASRQSVNRYAYNTNRYRDVLDEHDANGMLAVSRTIGERTMLKAQYYLTRYVTSQQVSHESNGTPLQASDFNQYFHRVEVIVSHHVNADLVMTQGAGTAFELLDNVSFSGEKSRQSRFAYAQADWQVAPALNAVAGMRYDHYTQYGGRLNPSAGIQYTLGNAITIKASAGGGFKTPDFKAMHQVFTNMQVGYTVIGAEQFGNAMNDLQEAGQVASISAAASRITSLKPETASSYNASITWSPHKVFRAGVNGFYNDVHNLISTLQVGTRTNGQQIFSYVNIARAVMKGLEANVQWKPVMALTLSAGYQLLYAIDRGVVDSIREGTGAYAKIRDHRTGSTLASQVKDYVGIDNRSRHMANASVFYSYRPWMLNATFRVNYRGRYGYADANNNHYIDRYDTFVDGYLLLNVSVEKKLLRQRLSLQLTAENLLNHTHMLMPGMPGRVVMAGVSWRFFKDDHVPASSKQ